MELSLSMAEDVKSNTGPGMVGIMTGIEVVVHVVDRLTLLFHLQTFSVLFFSEIVY